MSANEIRHKAAATNGNAGAVPWQPPRFPKTTADTQLKAWSWGILLVVASGGYGASPTCTCDAATGKTLRPTPRYEGRDLSLPRAISSGPALWRGLFCSDGSLVPVGGVDLAIFAAARYAS